MDTPSLQKTLDFTKTKKVGQLDTVKDVTRIEQGLISNVKRLGCRAKIDMEDNHCEKCFVAPLSFSHLQTAEGCNNNLCPCHKKQEHWKNSEPWVSIEGVLWDLHGNQTNIPEAMDLIHKYLS